jgi:import inner membrane translocase subunit TIM54
MIFLSITGGFTAAITYDRRQKRRAQQKWADLVAHISKETLPIEQNRRKLTVFLSAPPGDGLRSAREYFIEYVKPVLVSAALDYEVIEGRKEGDVRAGLAEKIREHRRQAGEQSTVVQEPSKELIIAETRRRMGVTDEPGPLGDIVIGRHTWKEYIRGLHEGWLGPLDPPPPPPELPTETPNPVNASEVPADIPAAESSESSENPDSSSAFVPEEKLTEPEKEKEKEKPKGPTPAYISTVDYSSRNLPATIPASFEASLPVPFPHLLGFLNTPIRIYRYLTKRYLADAVGQQVAAAVLASASRPYYEGLNNSSESDLGSSEPFTSETQSQQIYEQQTLLEHEEKEWHKSVRKAAEARKQQAAEDNSASVSDDTQATEKPNILKEEREWIDDVVIDPRIAARMSRYVLAPEEEARAKRIDEGLEWVLGEGERPKKLSFWQRVWIDYGYGEDPEVAKRKPILGNIDNEGE